MLKSQVSNIVDQNMYCSSSTAVPVQLGPKGQKHEGIAVHSHQKHLGGLRQVKDFETGAAISAAVSRGLTSPGAKAKSRCRLRSIPNTPACSIHFFSNSATDSRLPEQAILQHDMTNKIMKNTHAMIHVTTIDAMAKVLSPAKLTGYQSQER